MESIEIQYGYDVANPVMQIPLITPRVDGRDSIDFPVSNTQLAAVFGLEPLEPMEFVYCETAYYVQPQRKMAIVHGDFKLVYDKRSKRFGLYDLVWDPDENLNLYYPEFFDVDRRCWYSLNQRFYYPHWDTALKERAVLTGEWKRVWKNGPLLEEAREWVLFIARLIYMKLFSSRPGKNIINIGK